MAEILVIEDEVIFARNICDLLQIEGHNVLTSSEGTAGLELWNKQSPDLVLLDYRLPDINGLEVLRRLRKQGCSAAILMMTAYGKIQTAVEAMKLGANDFLTKPLDMKGLRLVVDRALEHRRQSASLGYFHEREASRKGRHMIAESPAMVDVLKFVERITSSKALSATMPPSILITGETGTGKDMLARTVHNTGPRRDAEFVLVNCTAMPDHLIESELFGHVKGAFTDARQNKSGLFEIADGGTVFLDEIGHMNANLQSKLLGVLEHRTIRPVGGTRERTVNVHVIAATNRDLEEAVRAGDFREDLFHRLRTLAVHIPPLRERPEDVCRLAEHFRDRAGHKFGIRAQRYDEDARRVLTEYDWPGNIRELAHVVESAVLMSNDVQISPEHLNLWQPDSQPPDIHIGSETTITLDFDGQCPNLEDIQLQVIQAAVDYSKGNLSEAARRLGISRDAIRYRLQKNSDAAGQDT